jgi:hypothetical protein
VVLVGDDDLVARRKQRPQGMGEHIDVAGGRGADDDLPGLGVDQRGEGRAPLGDALGGTFRRFVALARLDLAGGHEVRDPLDHLSRHQGAAGVLQEHPVAVERRELAAAEGDV